MAGVRLVFAEEYHMDRDSGDPLHMQNSTRNSEIEEKIFELQQRDV
jgi:hypothetical protein